jgi:outer membrane protein
MKLIDNEQKLGKKISNIYLSSIVSITAIILAIICMFLQLKSPTFAYINTQNLIQQYNGFKEAQDKLKETNREIQSKSDTLWAEFQRSLMDYEKEKSSLSIKKQKETETELFERRSKAEQYQQNIRLKLQEEEAKISQEVLNVINSYIQEYGKQNKYTIIFATIGGNIVYGSDAIDITSDIVEGLNERYYKK